MELRLQLGLNTTYDPLRRDDDISFLYESPYSEYRDLVLKGVFLEPPKLKEQKFEARFTRRQHLDEKTVDENLHRYEESPPKSVGSFVKQGHGCFRARPSKHGSEQNQIHDSPRREAALRTRKNLPLFPTIKTGRVAGVLSAPARSSASTASSRSSHGGRQGEERSDIFW
ncbi:MAG: hypothetical protein WA690_12910 [Candidatus Acidiferrales bacterium]